jgi:electron transfer flavoprotein alpha/beta subunit
MAAKKKPIDARTLESLGLPAVELQPRLSLEGINLPPTRPPGRILTGDPSATVPELVKLLHEEAKII